MALKLIEVLQRLWRNFKRGISIRNTVEEFLSLGYFKFPNVCFEAVEFWFKLFIQYEFFYPNIYPLNTVTFDERMQFLSELVAKNPSWTTAHFEDALKVTSQTIYNYMEQLGYIYTRGGWSKPLSNFHL
ncbi:hypothetical protein M0804_013705 [Polistes exclamans]|nr:hypothetical protein M0804_013705 [Polistes exclamans]